MAAITLQTILRQFAPAYLAKYGENIPARHKKVLERIRDCRSERYGIAIYNCEDCGAKHALPRACGDRHCPSCQQDKTAAWLKSALERRLPGHHFFLTFTVPQELRLFLRQHQRIGYETLFQASSATIKVFATDKKHLGGDLAGFWGVLHTWGRQIHHHPHIHYIVPGGIIRGEQWVASDPSFFAPVRAMSTVFRAKFRDAMKATGRYNDIPASVWTKAWNVNSQAVGDGEASIRYLAPYVFRVAISNARLVKIEGQRIHFTYTKAGGGRSRTMNLDALEFIRRFLQHVLPQGFQKVRHYGFCSHNCSVDVETVRGLIELAHGFALPAPRPEAQDEPELPPKVCLLCGGRLHYRESHIPTRKGNLIIRAVQAVPLTG